MNNLFHLGKSLQVIALIHTLLSHEKCTFVEKILILCPKTVVLNWIKQFQMWLPKTKKNAQVNVFELTGWVTYAFSIFLNLWTEINKYNFQYRIKSTKVQMIKKWHEEKGVLVVGYDMFRNLVLQSEELSNVEINLNEILVNPDLLICDEGHLLKNNDTSLSGVLSTIRTMRKIILTGTPLQNNLDEYYCMVDFVKPHLLGTQREFKNRFVNPIVNGQYLNSTDRDLQIMKRRSYVLHKLLDACIHRANITVLEPLLEPKYEYVLFVRLSCMQIKLYKVCVWMSNEKPKDKHCLILIYLPFTSSTIWHIAMHE